MKVNKLCPPRFHSSETVTLVDFRCCWSLNLACWLIIVEEAAPSIAAESRHIIYIHCVAVCHFRWPTVKLVHLFSTHNLYTLCSRPSLSVVESTAAHLVVYYEISCELQALSKPHFCGTETIHQTLPELFTPQKGHSLSTQLSSEAVIALRRGLDTKSKLWKQHNVEART